MSRGWRSKFWLYGLSVGIQDDLRERCSIGLLLKKLACLSSRIITGNSVRRDFAPRLLSLTEAISPLHHSILKPLSPLRSTPSRFSLLSPDHPNHSSVSHILPFSQLIPHLPSLLPQPVPWYHPQLSSTSTSITPSLCIN